MSGDQEMSGKDLMKSIKDQTLQAETKIDEEKLSQVKAKVMTVLPNLINEYDNEVPFTAIHEKTGLPYELIHLIIMDLLMKKDLLGFINDKSTSELSDDVLIIRKKRIIDSIEPEFRTG